MKTRLYPRLAAAFVITLLVLALLARFATTPQDVIVAEAGRGRVEVFVRAHAWTHVRDRYAVTAPVRAYPPHPRWHVGDHVRAGEDLLALVPAAEPGDATAAQVLLDQRIEFLRAALQAARNDAEAARSRVEAASEHLRLAEVNSGAAASDGQDAAFRLRDAEAHLRSAEFAVDIASHQLDAARMLSNALNDDPPVLPQVITLRAAVAGIVLAVARTGDGIVLPGETLLEIGRPESLEVHAMVAPSDAVRIEPGMLARVDGWGGEQVLHGRVRHVGAAPAQPDDGAGTHRLVRVILELTSPYEDWRRLGDGYPLQAAIRIWQGSDLLRVPVAALYRQEDRWMVTLVRNGRAYGMPVTVGHRGDRYAEIRGGLDAGDRVLLEPGAAVPDGRRVAPRLRADPATTGAE